MGFNWQSGDDVSTGGGFLDVEGTFHLAVTGVDEDVTKKDGSLIDNAAFRLHMEVCDGTVPGQKGKTKEVTFFHPKAGQKNDGEFARKKIDRVFLATNLMTMEQLGKPGEFDLQAMCGQQLVMKFTKEKPDDKYVELHFTEIYHVDDPAVTSVPKDAGMLKLIPPQFRMAAKKPAADAGKNGAAAAAKSTKPAVNLDALEV